MKLFKKVVLPITAFLIFCASAIIPAVPVITSGWVKLESEDAVYRMNIYVDGVERGHGTGFFVKLQNGSVRILTNMHICVTEDSTTEVRLDDGRTTTKEAFDWKNDLCLLKVAGPTEHERPLKLAAAGAEQGADLYVIGHPWGGTRQLSVGRQDNQIEMPALQFLKGTEPASAQKDCVYHLDIFGENELCTIWRHTDRLALDIRPGNSGSPIMNSDGNVVGVVWGWYPADMRGLGVKYDAVKAILGYN